MSHVTHKIQINCNEKVSKYSVNLTIVLQVTHIFDCINTRVIVGSYQPRAVSVKIERRTQTEGTDSAASFLVYKTRDAGSDEQLIPN